MKNIWPIVKRELRSAFDHPTAYILMVVFLAALLFFGFRAIYLQNVSSLLAFWDILPWLLLFYVPAVTMRSLAEERRSGTLELLMSQPLTLTRLIIAKIVAGSVLVLAPLLLTLIVALSMLSVASFDGGQVVAQYVALVFIVVTQVAIGVTASALTRNQVVGFITSFALILLLTIAGFEVVTAEFPGWLRSVLTQISLLGHFNNMTRGVLDLRDVLYFASLTFFFGTLAQVALAKAQLAAKKAKYRRLRVNLVLVAIIVVLVNVLASYIPGRLDLSASQLYSLAPATQKLVSHLTDPLEVKVFSSAELPPQVALVERDARDLIDDLGRASQGKIKITNIKVTDTGTSADEASKLGIQAVQFNILDQQQFSVRQGYFGLAVVAGDQHETIPFIQDTGNLEYQLVSFIRKLTLKEKSLVGLAAGHGELTAISTLRTELGSLYEIEDVDFAKDDFKNLKTLLIIGPTEAYADKDLAKLKKYLESGGSVLALINGVNVNPQYLTAVKGEEALSKMFEPYGLKINQDLVYDLSASESVTFGGGVFSLISAYPLWPRAQIAGEHPITERLGQPSLIWPSSLTKLENPDYDFDFTELLSTTDAAGSQTDTFNISPQQRWQVNKKDLSKKLLAAAITLKSKGQSAANANDPLGRLVVIGNADFINDAYSRNNPSNLALALNSVDWLAQDEALLGIRAKNRAPAPLVFKADWQPSLIRLSNLIGLPLLVIIFGAIRMLNRRSKTKRLYSI